MRSRFIPFAGAGVGSSEGATTVVGEASGVGATTAPEEGSGVGAATGVGIEEEEVPITVNISAASLTDPLCLVAFNLGAVVLQLGRWTLKLAECRRLINLVRACHSTAVDHGGDANRDIVPNGFHVGEESRDPSPHRVLVHVVNRATLPVSTAH